MRGLLRQTASGFATTNLWAETAWTGFVQARLQARRGGLPAAVGTAALFTRQHLPLLAVTGSGVELAVIRPVGFALAIPFRALVAWRYTRPGGVCLVGLLHAAGDAAAAGVGGALLTRLYPHHNVALFPIGVEGLIGRAVLAGTRARLGLPARAARPVSTKTVRARSRV